MLGIFWNLLLYISLGVSLGYWLNPLWLKYIELFAIIALIGQSILSVQKHQVENRFSIKLEKILYLIGCGLILCSIKVASDNSFYTIIGWLIFISFYQSLSKIAANFSEYFNKYQLGFLLCLITGISFGFGYLANVYIHF